MPTTSQKTTTIPSESTNKQAPPPFTRETKRAEAAWEFGAAPRIVKHEQMLEKYDSIGGMKKQEKIKALSDNKTNPFMLKDGYDGLTNVLNRWKTMATSKEAAALSPEAKTKAASNYYDTMIKPMYDKMGATPISKEEWLNHSYSTALKWDINGAYDSHWRSGLYEGFKDYENIGRTAIGVLGGVITRNIDFGKALVAGKGKEYLAEGQKETKEKGVMGALYSDAAKIPVLASTMKSLARASSVDGFWHDINPNQNWKQGLGSFITEQAMMLPLYNVGGAVNEAGLDALGTANLTKTLSATPMGKLASRLLTNGAEGLAYGFLMRDEGDKHNSWQDAISSAILGTALNWKGSRIKLEDTSKEAADKVAEKSYALTLGKKGLKEATSAEDMHGAIVHSTSGNLAAGGVPFQSSVVRQAINFIQATEGASKDYVRGVIQANLKDDRARWQPIHEMGQYIRALLGDRKISSLTDADKAEINQKLSALIHQASEEAPARLKEMQEAAGKETAKTLKESKSPSAKFTRESVIASITKQVQDAGLKKTPEEIEKIADAKIAQDAAKLSAKAAAEQARKPVSEALDVAAKAKKVAPKTPASLKIRSSYTTNKAGEPAVSFSINPEWKAYAKKTLKDNGKTWSGRDIKEWLDGLSSEDFAQDLHDYFYPKELKEEGIHFEQATNREGKQNPNFLAFMYNYRDQMPREVASRLSQELEDTLKFEEGFNPKVDVEMQKRYFAEGMWNHMAEFMGSPSFLKKGMQNIFRTTMSDLKNPTRWQEQLHTELIAQEQEAIKKIYKGKPEAQNAALAAYNLLAKDRLKAMKKGDQGIRREMTEKIDDLFTSTGKYEKREF